jgi:hypothetical protein
MVTSDAMPCESATASKRSNRAGLSDIIVTILLAEMIFL